MFDFFKKKTKDQLQNDNSSPEKTSAAAQDPGKKTEEVRKVLPYFASEQGKARYALEHRLLKDLFFSDSMRTAAVLLQGGQLFDMFDRILKQSKLDNPYSKKDFRTEGMRFGGGISS